ncbi:EH domain-binding protein 1-like [Montipora capricornis]|uniref:EH domain-binding protein 1-like n=1 Tax=Montipora capricornis TaxID=246305 RepID=UPI0035F1572A
MRQIPRLLTAPDRPCHYNLGDFSSLDPSNIKDNCKLAFSAFEKLGIPRLLDPTQMMFSRVPDKLSVMTYVFQIKAHFTKTPVPQPSLLNLRKPVPRSHPAPPPPEASREAPADSGKGNVANSSSDTGNGGDSKETNGSKEPYNPFLEDTEDVEMDASPEGSSSPATKRSDAGDSKSSEKELISWSSYSSPESKLSMLEDTSKELESNVKKEAKPPPKPPRFHQGTDSPVVDTKTKPSGSIEKKEKSVSKALFNPFDAEDNEESSPVPLKTRKPPEGYNPFDEDNSFNSQENNGSGKGRKVGSNPFDEADDNDVVTEATKAADQNVEKKEKQQRKVSYPHSFNPFGDDDDIESKGIEEKEESSSKGYNPFDDDNDNEGEGVSNNATPVKRLPRKSSLQNKEKGNQSPQTGRASPSGGLKQPVKNVKKRQAPPPPAVKSSDDPWTARLPDKVMARRRRPTRPNTPGAAEQPSPHTSPARSGPKRSVPTPPRRPPLIPSFDEWKGDRGVAGDNERPPASQSAENLSKKTNSSEEVDESRKTSSPSPDTSARRSPKVSSGDGPNQADIKLLARQVLMDARKKAGASGSTGALPRERVAEITKTKGPTSNALGAQDKDNKSDNQEALKKKESLRLRREELQRKKKVNEKAQKLVQNAIGKEMGQKLAESSSEQLITETQTKDVDAETSDTNTEQKTVKNKNLQHRPLKLKDKENESKKRRPSVEKDGNTSPDKPGFQESEELQRIRQILNQGKKSKKPSDSENIEQQNGKINPQKSDSSKERNIFDSKSSTKNATVNGLSKSTTPSAPLRSNTHAPNAGLHAYIESRKIYFEVFEVPADQSQSDGQEVAENDTNSCVENRVDGTSEPNSDQTSSDPEETQTREFQDTSEYVRQELRSLEEQQEALDKVGEKLEMELRRAMECRGCEEEQEKLMQDWFLLVNKKNELVRRQAELNLLKNEEDLERSHDMLQGELRALLEMEDSQKTNEQREREAELMEQLLSVVNKRDQLVQFEDSQLQQAEKDALHVQKVIANARIPRDRSDCVLQ